MPKRVELRRSLERGFTLVEVLVALTVAALVLGAALRAAGAMTVAQERAQQVTYAGWSAENRLAEVRLADAYPEIGRGEVDCSQGTLVLVCITEVQPTANRYMRRITVTVHPTTERLEVWARRTGFAADLPRFPGEGS